ncbi:MAG: MarR family transcriptional regulator [Actinomycetota bacterium]|nr:MarR family transcriptional regulator [Actinomycetota bacterium]
MSIPSAAPRGMPSLLRAARSTYVRSVRRSLTSDGYDDVPRNGAFVLATGLDRSSATAVQDALGITKQAASQLIDTLVVRGYLERHPHPSDRRRTELELTDRGHGAAAAVRRGVGSVEHELAHHLSAQARGELRAALGLLADLGGPGSAAQSAPQEQPVRLMRVAPVFPVTDVERSLEHYATLGFRVEPYPDGGYGFGQRDGVGIHFNAVPDLDPATNNNALYLYVSDADALAAQWSSPGIGGETIPPVDTDYDMREGAHLDPDRNLIRFGAPLVRS